MVLNPATCAQILKEIISLSTDVLNFILGNELETE